VTERVDSVPSCRRSQFRDHLTRARAEGELHLVAKLEDNPDWRAAAFLLERGYREHWAKEEPQQSSVTITLTDEQLAARESPGRNAPHPDASGQREGRDITEEVGCHGPPGRGLFCAAEIPTVSRSLYVFRP
jgi:hypothetical protein